MKIVCINNKDTSKYSSGNLTVGKTYESLSIGDINTLPDVIIHCLIYDDNGGLNWFAENRFISLKDYRKEKLDKINEIR